MKRQAFLCKIPKICQTWCRISGHSDGTCDEQEDCNCSTEPVDRHFCSDEYDAEEQHTICAGWCQFRGKQTGNIMFLLSNSNYGPFNNHIWIRGAG